MLVINSSEFHELLDSHPIDEKKHKWYQSDLEAIAQHISSIDWNTLICYNPSALSSWSAFLNILCMYPRLVVLTKVKVNIKVTPVKYTGL